MTDQGRSKPPRVTSVEIGPRTRILCWAFGITLVAAGAVAAFVSNNQAGTTALVLFGGLLLFIAITRRIPLLIEVGTAKLDTSYEATDFVFEAGREAAAEVNEPDLAGETAVTDAQRRDVLAQPYRGVVAAMAAGITYRQLDYWVRTELVTPTHRVDNPGEARGALFSPNDVILLRVVKELLDLGLSLQEIRQIIDTLRHVDLAGLYDMFLVHDRAGTHIVTTVLQTELDGPSTVVRLRPVIDRVVQVLASFDGPGALSVD